MHKKLFIFDLDGVLVEACDWHRDALNEALKETADYCISQEDHINIFNGIPTKIKLQILSEWGIIESNQHDKINQLKQRKTIEIINQKAFLRQEKVELMDEIINLGHHLACYTNSIKQTATLMLEKTGILNKFEIVLTNQDVVSPKPSPEGYIYLIDRFGVNRGDCYIIEDSPKGIEAAMLSGANVIQVRNADEVTLQNLRSLL